MIDGNLTIRDIFVDLLEHDPAPEVRKAVLTQIDVHQSTISYILNRRKDLDVGVRRFFFATKLQEIEMSVLSMTQRDAILKSGLHDRDMLVRKACIDVLFGTWYSENANSNLVHLVECLDVVNDPELGERVFEEFFKLYQNKLYEDGLPEGYIENLTVEFSFILKVYCKHIGAEEADTLLPEVSRMTEALNRFYRLFLSKTVVKSDVEFVMLQLMQLISFKDMSDEAGRKAVISLTTEMLSNIEISDELFVECIKLNSMANPVADDFIEAMARLMIDFKDFYSSPGDEDNLVIAQIKCLLLIQETVKLQNRIDPEGYLWAVLNEIVIPAVNSSFAVVQEAGLQVLGLYCTLSDDLSNEYRQLFVDFLRMAKGGVRVEALKVLFDLILLNKLASNDLTREMTASLYDTDIQVQAAAAEGFSKLLLHKVPLTDPQEILEGLFTLYHYSTTTENTKDNGDEAQSRRTQCLAYFVQAFVFSRPENQAMLRSIAVKFLVSFCTSVAQASEDSNKKVQLVFAHLLYLLDPENLVQSSSTIQHTEEESYDWEWERFALELAWSMVERENHAIVKILATCLNKIPLKRGGPIVQELIIVLSHAIKLFAGISALGKVLTSATALEGNEALDQEMISEIKRRLNYIAPIAATSNLPTIQTQKKKLPPSKKGIKDISSIPNLLDDLDDILDS
jgi:condensin complex subunit 3